MIIFDVAQIISTQLFYVLIGMTNNNTLHAYFTAISSACASIITKFLIYPIETIKTKVQVNPYLLRSVP